MAIELDPHKNNKKILENLHKRKFIKPAFAEYKKCIEYFEDKIPLEDTYITLLDNLTTILNMATKETIAEIEKKSENKKFIDDRARQKSIENTIRSVAGNNFQALIARCLIDNIEVGNLSNILISIQANNNRDIKDYTTIYVKEDFQKPDLDIVAYDLERSKSPIVSYSCKTSFRERAGQTYKWKLLYDIVTSKCNKDNSDPNCLRKKYELNFKGNKEIFVGLICADFYDEILNPQIEGMINFFDYFYISKSLTGSKKVPSLSMIISDLNKLFPRNL